MLIFADPKVVGASATLGSGTPKSRILKRKRKRMRGEEAEEEAEEEEE